MTLVDWLLVLVINGGIVVYGIISFRTRGEGFDWCLAAKSMLWWDDRPVRLWHAG